MKKDAKNPSKLKTGLEGALGHNNTVRQNSVFLYGGLISTIRKKKEPMIREVTHKFIGSASMRLAL